MRLSGIGPRMRNPDPIADYYSFVDVTKTSQFTPVIGETGDVLSQEGQPILDR